MGTKESGSKAYLEPEVEVAAVAEPSPGIANAAPVPSVVDRWDLKRFVEAQEGKAEKGVPYAAALAEMRAGAKTECWVWYVFPQFIDRKSAMSTRYQIHSADEARGYLRHPLLGPRYAEIAAAALAALRKQPVAQVMFGAVDGARI